MKKVVSSKKMDHSKNLKPENFKYHNNDLNTAKVNKKISSIPPKSTTGNANMKSFFENANIL